MFLPPSFHPSAILKAICFDSLSDSYYISWIRTDFYLSVDQEGAECGEFYTASIIEGNIWATLLIELKS